MGVVRYGEIGLSITNRSKTVDAIALSQEDRDFVERQVRNGDYAGAGAVVLLLMSEAEQSREAWLAEVRRRRDDLESGAIQALSLEEARTMSRARQKAARTRG